MNLNSWKKDREGCNKREDAKNMSCWGILSVRNHNNIGNELIEIGISCMIYVVTVNSCGSWGIIFLLRLFIVTEINIYW